MIESISCTPRSTQAELRQAFLRGPGLWSFTVFTAIVIISVISDLVSGLSLSTIASLFIWAGVQTLWFFVLPMRAERKQRDASWVLTAELVDVSNGSVRGQFRWEHFKKLIVGRRVILLMLPGRGVFLLPRRSLTLDETEQVVAWAAVKGVRVVLDNP